MQMILEVTNQSLDFTKTTPITRILQRLIGRLNNHLHNLQTINNGSYIAITVTVTVNKYHQSVCCMVTMTVASSLIALHHEHLNRMLPLQLTYDGQSTSAINEYHL